MKFFDRLLTIVITATLTSIFWIVFGGTLLEMANDRQDVDEVDVVEPTPITAPTPSAPPIMEERPEEPPLAPTPEPAPTSAGPGEPAAQPQMPPVGSTRGLPTGQRDR